MRMFLKKDLKCFYTQTPKYTSVKLQN